MAKTTYMATVQIILPPGTVESTTEACDWFSGLLTENPNILDWGYLNVGGQILSPSEKLVDDEYCEGDFLNH